MENNDNLVALGVAVFLAVIKLVQAIATKSKKNKEEIETDE